MQETKSEIELKSLVDNTLQIFDIKSISDLRKSLYAAVRNIDVDKMQKFVDFVGDLSIDYLQKIFQYYEADRKEKKQYFTPKTLGVLCSELTKTDGKIVYDMCAGSGALTIQKWVQNPNKIFICAEFDNKVIPFLLFNLAIRNIKGYVIHGDVLTKQTWHIFKLVKGEKFSTVKRIVNAPDFCADEIISNPPYNVKWQKTDLCGDTEKIKNIALPPESCANFAFCISALAHLKEKGRCCFILPNGVLSSDTEYETRKTIIENGLLEKVILLPRNMFESTDISTCVFVFSNNNKSVEMFDLRNSGLEEQRLQNGQFGGSSHTGRTYIKTVNILSDEIIEKVCKSCENAPNFSRKVTFDEIKKQDYILTPSRYIEFKCDEKKHRDFQEIADNINYIMRMQNSCKLIINETLAKNLGFDVPKYKEDKETSKKVKENMKAIGVDVIEADYISFTKNKNEFSFVCNDKELLPDIFIHFLSTWKNNIALLNTMQNKYLEELRDTLLPELMNGNIDVSNVKISDEK